MKKSKVIKVYSANFRYCYLQQAKKNNEMKMYEQYIYKKMS